MYSTCLYCSRDLGANAIIETLPIGRRVAFDESTGRLWVICRGCEKWNLVPFDSRLETIEACEKLFRDAKLKFSTDNIGIARLPEGLELVRVGRAERQEFAAWRYGDQFGRRRRKRIALWSGAGVAVAGAIVLRHTVAPWIPITGAGGFQVWNYGYNGLRSLYRNRRIATSVADTNSSAMAMTVRQVHEVRFHLDRDTGGLVLDVKGHERTTAGFATEWGAQHVTITGARVVPALGRILPHLNRMNGTRDAVRNAVDLLGDSPSAKALIASQAMNPTKPNRWGLEQISISGGRTGQARRSRLAGAVRPGTSYLLREFPSTGRLALEMLAHEDTERAALAGELKLLERHWREADRVAKIADDLVLDVD